MAYVPHPRLFVDISRGNQHFRIFRNKDETRGIYFFLGSTKPVSLSHWALVTTKPTLSKARSWCEKQLKEPSCRMT